MYGGRYHPAVTILERALAKSESPTEWTLAYALYNAGRTAEAEAMLRKRAAQGGNARTLRRTQATLASILAARGDAEGARKLIAVVTASSYKEHHVSYALGVAYARLDMSREALMRLREAHDSGFRCYPWFAVDPLLESFRRKPESRPFFNELKRSWELMKAQYPAGS